MNSFNINLKKVFSVFALILALSFALILSGCSKSNETTSGSNNDSTYKVSEEEKAYLKEKFDKLVATNKDTIAYMYAPGTQLDEPVVQTTDNVSYLEKTFEGGRDPYLGTVFMDVDNSKLFDDRLTWLFGHARGSKVTDHRMFNDVNFFEEQTYFDEHPYLVIETPERKYYYEAAFLTVVPEDTEYYVTEFSNDAELVKNLTGVRSTAKTNNPNVKIDAKDKYLVLGTCREDGETIRSLLYYRAIPDNELTDFLSKNKDKLNYVATR